MSKSSHIEIPAISSQTSASAHILTNHTVGGWEQKWRHILNFVLYIAITSSEDQRKDMVWLLLGWDMAVHCAISEGFAETALESVGFLLFSYPQPVSLCSFISPPLFLHSTVSPFHWFLCGWENIQVSREANSHSNNSFKYEPDLPLRWLFFCV